MNGWRAAVCRLFRVPPEPAPPPGTTARTFRAARNFLILKSIIWMISHVFILLPAIVLTAIAAGYIVVEGDPRTAQTVIAPIAFILWIIFGVRLVLGYAVVLLDYEMRWYIVSDRAIRIREGILNVKEKTITFANIQNVTVKQGPLERMLGISNVEVRTAGGGTGGGKKGEQSGHEEPMHVGMFRGVDNADQIRDLVLSAVRRQKDSGLGDPDDAYHHDAETSDIEAASLFVEECRALRRVVTEARA